MHSSIVTLFPRDTVVVRVQKRVSSFLGLRACTAQDVTPASPTPRHYFRPPTEDEFWVVSLHQVATIHNVELTNNGTHKRRTSLTANTVTVVQPFSLGRVSALPVLCTAWDGPVSIALYVPLSESGNVYLPKNTMLHNATVQEAQQYIEQLVHQLPGCKEDVEVLHVVQAHTWFLPPTSGKCSMQVVMVTETLPSNTTLLDEDYYTIPINALRNIALEHAPSEVVVAQWVFVHTQNTHTYSQNTHTNTHRW